MRAKEPCVRPLMSVGGRRRFPDLEPTPSTHAEALHLACNRNAAHILNSRSSSRDTVPTRLSAGRLAGSILPVCTGVPSSIRHT
jgi:hypothetical protein